MAKKITLKSSDGEEFVLDKMVAMKFQAICHMIEDECEESSIPLPNVTSNILSKIIEYCKKHVDAAAASTTATSASTKSSDEELKQWDQDFIKVDHDTLFDLILAANNLKIKDLLDLASETVGDTVKGQTVGEIKKMFNIKNEFISFSEFWRDNHGPLSD